MSIRSRAILAALLLLVATSARSDGIFNPGKGGVSDRTFGFLLGGQSSGGGGGCTMNGIFDLTNTCNDIYFIGGLK